jgi:ribose-phosphate pyrophosphokinase
VSASLHAFAADRAPASRLAAALGLDLAPVEVRSFPDGESLVRVAPPAESAILYRSLDDPNDKLVELILAAAALRDSGARHVLLIAPYLPYMRQDRAFHGGEAVSQRVIGGLIASHFDALVTVDPHLHRTPRLELVVPGCAAFAVSGAPVLAEALRDASHDAVIVGPDAESQPWVEAIAARLGRPFLIGTKVRRGDDDVELALPGVAAGGWRRAIIVDDMISTGTTMRAAARLLRQHGVEHVEAAVVHCLARAGDIAALQAAGIEGLRAADSVAGPHATLPLAPVLAPAVAGALVSLAAGSPPRSSSRNGSRRSR